MSRTLWLWPECGECRESLLHPDDYDGPGLDIGGISSTGAYLYTVAGSDVMEIIACALAHPDERVAFDGFDEISGREFVALFPALQHPHKEVDSEHGPQLAQQADHGDPSS
jgi:hypothetical protein